jgi:hypothetical protein
VDVNRLAWIRTVGKLVNEGNRTSSNIPRVMLISCGRSDDPIPCMGVLEYPTNAIAIFLSA